MDLELRGRSSRYGWGCSDMPRIGENGRAIGQLIRQLQQVLEGKVDGSDRPQSHRVASRVETSSLGGSDARATATDRRPDSSLFPRVSANALHLKPGYTRPDVALQSQF